MKCFNVMPGRKVYVLMLFNLLSGATNAQSTDAEIKPFKIKKGIYYSFNEVVTETPIFTDSFRVKERSVGSIAMAGGGKYTFELPFKSKNEFRKVREACVGFSDGSNFYISDRYTTKNSHTFTQCVLSCPYIVATVSGNAGQSTGGGLIPSLIKTSKSFLINVKDKTSIQLSRKVINKLLTKHPDLEEQYREEKDLMGHAFEIIEKINEKEKN